MFVVRIFKKTLVASVFTLLLWNTVLPLNINAMKQTSNEVGISAEGAMLIDVESGRILYERNPDRRMRIASLTKILTAIVAIEHGNLDDIVTTSNNAFGVEGSSIYLQEGEKMSLENLLYGLMLRSGNDAAVAIAEHVGGSIEGFVFLMNEKAKYIGMHHSNFMNPHGLDHENHYSTPRDMAILTSYALKNPVFKQIVSTKVKTVPLEGEEWDRKWYNKNKLLSRYQFANGVKTGYTKIAKRCLSSSATKDEVQLAAITLNAPNDWNDHIRLFEYGFNNYQRETLVNKGETIAKGEGYNIVASREFGYLFANGEKDYITMKITIKNTEKYEAGEMKFYFKENYIGIIPLVNLEKEAFSDKIQRVCNEFW